MKKFETTLMVMAITALVAVIAIMIFVTFRTGANKKRPKFGHPSTVFKQARMPALRQTVLSTLCRGNTRQAAPMPLGVGYYLKPSSRAPP